MIAIQEIGAVQELIRTGRRQAAVDRLRYLLGQDARDYRLWLLLATVAPPDRQAACLQQAEKLAPDAPAVQKARAWMDRREASAHLPPTALEPPRLIRKPETATPPSPGLSLDHLREKAVREGTPAAAGSRRRLYRRPLFWIILLALLALGASAGWALRPRPASSVQNSAPEAISLVADQPEPENEPVAQVQATAEVMPPTPTPTRRPTDVPPPTATPVLLEAKQIVASSLGRAQWTPTPVPTSTPIPTATIEPTAVIDNYARLNWPHVGENERWVDVNLTTQTLTAYEGRTPVLETLISSGRAPYYTVTGQFRIYYRLESQTMDGRRLGFDYVTEGVPWVQYFYGDFALHGAFWHNNFGTPVSHGCVNMTVADAQWLYSWSDYGMLVNVHY